MCSKLSTFCLSMAKTHSETSHFETAISQQHQGAYVPEDEPTGDYRVGWRTLMAIIALSMANACAAIANTVCKLLATAFTEQ